MNYQIFTITNACDFENYVLFYHFHHFFPWRTGNGLRSSLDRAMLLILFLSLTHTQCTCESAFLLHGVLAGGAIQDIMVSFCLSKWEGEKESINIKICPRTCQNMLPQSLLSLTTRATKKKEKTHGGLAFREGNAKGQKVVVYLNCAYKQMVISRHSCILGLYLYG